MLSGKTLANEYPRYDNKLHLTVKFQSGRMQSTLSLPLRAGQPWSGIIKPVWVTIIGQTELFEYLNECKQTTDAKMNC